MKQLVTASEIAEYVRAFSACNLQERRIHTKIECGDNDYLIKKLNLVEEFQNIKSNEMITFFGIPVYTNSLLEKNIVRLYNNKGEFQEIKI